MTISIEEVVPTRNEGDAHVSYDTETIEKTLLKNIKAVHSNKSFTDFTVKCGDERFECHKVILANRSDVLCAMLKNETEDKIQNEVEIKDTSTNNVRGMIDYIYTGKIPEDIEDTCGEMIYLAAKYHLPE